MTTAATSFEQPPMEMGRTTPAQLVWAITVINAWNRITITTRMPFTP